MKTLLSLTVVVPLLFSVACGGDTDSCVKLTKDVCDDDKACATYVEKDVLEGNKAACSMLVNDKDYKEWIEGAKDSYANSKK